MHRQTQFFRLLLCLAAATAVAGCATTRGTPERALPCASDGIIDRYTTLVANYEADGASESTRLRARNEVIGLVMRQIDCNYFDFVGDLQEETTRSRTWTDTAATVFNTTGSLVSGGETSEIMSGLAGITTGVRTSLDSHALADQTIPALVSTMNARRIEVGERIAQKIGLSTDRYNLYQAGRDLDAYAHAGTLISALAYVNAQAARHETEAEIAREVRLATEPRAAEFFSEANQERMGAIIDRVQALGDEQIEALELPATARSALRANWPTMSAAQRRSHLMPELFGVAADTRSEAWFAAWEAALTAAESANAGE